MARTLTRSASAPLIYAMAVLLIILLLTVGLSVRAGIYGARWGRRWTVADTDTTENPWLMDACARAFIIVLLSLLGLLALGVMYGNVLGAVSAGR
jgi:hypothetical protein